MEYQDEHVLRVIGEAGAALRLASQRFHDGASADEALDLADEAIRLVVEIDPSMFLEMAPMTMVTLLDISGYDDRLVTRLADALEFEAEVLEGNGLFLDAGVRREQAAAVRESIDPRRAN